MWIDYPEETFALRHNPISDVRARRSFKSFYQQVRPLLVRKHAPLLKSLTSIFERVGWLMREGHELNRFNHHGFLTVFHCPLDSKPDIPARTQNKLSNAQLFYHSHMASLQE